MVFAGAGDPGVETSGERRDASPKHPDNSPDNMLRGQGGGPIPKGKDGIQEDFPSPSDGEENCGHRVEDEPSIPSRHIKFPNEDAVARVMETDFLDERDDCGGCGK